MRSYRAYRLNPTGKIMGGEWLQAPDDEAAKAMAARFCDVGAPCVELWEAGRLVGRLDCQHQRPNGRTR